MHFFIANFGNKKNKIMHGQTPDVLILYKNKREKDMSAVVISKAL